MARPQPATRDRYAHFLTISTRWMDNDVYRHVNNVVYYSFFDTAVNEYMLRSGFGSKSQPSEALIDEWFELWSREGQREAQLDRLSQYKVFDVESAFRAVTKPVLLLWGEENTTAKYEQAAEVQHLLENADVTFISYPGVGHMAVQQAGAEIAVDVRAWLDGKLPREPASQARNLQGH